MEKPGYEYTIIEAKTAGELEKLVTDLLAKHWELYGSIMVCKEGGQDAGMIYIQAMLKQKSSMTFGG